MIPIIIPSYEPDDRLLTLVAELCAAEEGRADDDALPVIIVNDGSGSAFDPIFRQAASYSGSGCEVTVISHERNRGKGRALKTAFAHVLERYPDAVGAVTADSDGQHTPASIMAVAETLNRQQDHLILGVRDFSGADVPWKSRMGNRITERIFLYLSGLHVSDTQTGLRGIPALFMKKLLDTPGERFEFEMQMLLDAAGQWPVTEVPIATVYDSRENHQTHFNPVADSIKIYALLWQRFARYFLSSVSASALDLALFALFCSLLRSRMPAYIAVSTIAARCISAVYNYLVNYRLVFSSKKSVRSSGTKYAALAVLQMLASSLLVTGGCALLPFVPEVAVKAVVDTFLFFVSYHLQQRFIF